MRLGAGVAAGESAAAAQLCGRWRLAPPHKAGIEAGSHPCVYSLQGDGGAAASTFDKLQPEVCRQ